MRKINDSKGNLLCIVYKDEDWVEGLNFITDNSLSCIARHVTRRKIEVLVLINILAFHTFYHFFCSGETDMF